MDRMGFEGTRKSMAAGEAAVQEWFKTKLEKQGGGNLEKALADWSKTVSNLATIYENQSDTSDEVLATMQQIESETERTKQPVIDIAKAKEKQAEKEKKASEKQSEITGWKEKISQAEQRIAKLAEAEANARQSAQNNATAAKRIGKIGVADQIEGSAASNEALKEEDKRNARANRRLQISREKQARGVTLSRKDQAALDAADRQKAQTETLAKAKERDLKEAAAAKASKENYEKNVAEYSRRTAVATEEMRDFLKESVMVQ